MLHKRNGLMSRLEAKTGDVGDGSLKGNDDDGNGEGWSLMTILVGLC